MKCPQCGQSNFKWARRCDRCKGPLTATPAPASPGREPRRGPQDAGDEWPDAQASLAPVVGRTFAFNGVSYTAQERSRRLRDSDVYPLRHNASQLVTFEMKVFRCDPGSERYAEVRQGPPRAFRTKATLARPDDPGA